MIHDLYPSRESLKARGLNLIEIGVRVHLWGKPGVLETLPAEERPQSWPVVVGNPPRWHPLLRYSQSPMYRSNVS